MDQELQPHDLPAWLAATLRVYPWRRIAPTPCATLRRPLAECRVALVTSGGLIAPGQEPFDHDVRGGDFSYRVIPGDAEVGALVESHRSATFDHSGIESDANLAFPLDRLRELAAAGEIGEVAPRHLSFMGSITAPGRLVKRTAPEAADLLVVDGVDVALLVPV
jgi:D-proline reductase (dithiol) PrdB